MFHKKATRKYEVVTELLNGDHSRVIKSYKYDTLKEAKQEAMEEFANLDARYYRVYIK